VTTQPEKAVIPTGNTGAITGITSDENLTIINNTTGVSVTVALEAGDNAQTIADKINEYTDVVGMTASTDGTDITATSSEYGSAADFTIYSDFPATDGSQSGFADDGSNTDAGVDVAGTFTYDSVEYQVNGVGAVLNGRSASPAEGLRIWYTGATGADVATVYVSNNSLTFQVGANAGQTVSVDLANMGPRELGRGLDAAFSGENMFANLSEINVLTADAATDALAVIDQAIKDVSTVRGDMGAFQSNTLENTLNNLRVAQENLVAAESVIRDTDMAGEVANFTRGQILVQTASAMLAQANATPNVVLQLLQ
jgi:flagellin